MKTNRLDISNYKKKSCVITNQVDKDQTFVTHTLEIKLLKCISYGHKFYNNQRFKSMFLSWSSLQQDYSGIYYIVKFYKIYHEKICSVFHSSIRKSFPTINIIIKQF